MRSQIEHSFEPSQNPENTFNDQIRRGSPSPATTPDAEDRQKRLEARLERNLSTPKMRDLKKGALRYFADWQDEVISTLGKLINAPEDPRIDQKRKDFLAARNPPPPPYSVTPSGKDPTILAAADARKIKEVEDISMLHHMYHPIPTRLNTISKEDRVCVISCMVLLLLSLGHYSAHSRVLLCYLTSAFELPLEVLTNEETEIARTLMLASKALSADSETQKRKDENASSRMWKVGLASVAGAALIGITGGLAAPVVAGAIGGIMGGVGLGGLASVLGIFAMNGALVGTLFGAYGAAMTGTMVDNYSKEVEDFKFLPINEEWESFGTREEEEVQGRRLRVTVGINGWLKDKDDVIKPWRIMGQDSEVFALRYEMEALIELGTSLGNMVSSYAWSMVKMEILKRTVLATLFSALWPVYLVKMATSIDNPFSVARNRSEKAGEVLADALINKAQGERPVTLVGYSLGSRVIYSCLKSLAERHAFGLVESVVLIGSPVPSNSENWRVMRSVVSGQVINVYSENDYILGFLYRATSIQYGVAGLQKIDDVEGVENVNLSKEVSGHLRYPELIGKILKRCGFVGIKVEDTVIEEETASEIQLVDVEEDNYKVSGNKESLSQTLLMDAHPVEIGPGRGERDVIRKPVWASEKSKSDEVISTRDERDIRRKPLMASDKYTSNDPLLNEGMAGMSLRDEPAVRRKPVMDSKKSEEETTQRMAALTMRDEDSDEDHGGIIMMDNDSDGELTEVPSVPVEDDPRQSRKAVFMEPKSLGSFPKAKEPRKKVTASDMGLY